MRAAIELFVLSVLLHGMFWIAGSFASQSEQGVDWANNASLVLFLVVLMFNVTSIVLLAWRALEAFRN